MLGLLKDGGLDGLRGTIERCDDCETSTIHLTAPSGVPVCSLCGYNPIFDALAGESSDELPTSVVPLPSIVTDRCIQTY
jgi:hypothetical protein